MKVRFLMVLGMAMLCLGYASLAGASQITVNFDNMSAACCAGNNNTTQDVLSKWLSFGVMRIDGGMVMQDPHATSAPNVYEAFNVLPPLSNNLSGSNNVPDRVEMLFASPVSNVGFDVINGGAPSTFTAYAFGSGGNALGTETFTLNCATCTGAVEHVSFDFGGIGEVVVRSGASSANFIDFAVDTVKFSTVPEPGGLALMGSGIVALWSQRKRLFNR
jgi:PEP-CTERM motif